MAKNQKSDKKQSSAPVHAKRGLVVNRAANHTIDQNRKASQPRWKDIGGGVIQSTTNSNNYLFMQGGKWTSLPKHQVDYLLAEQARRDAEMKKFLSSFVPEPTATTTTAVV